jgi:hypothetical protein
MKLVGSVMRTVLVVGLLAPIVVTSSPPHIHFYIFDVHGTLEVDGGSSPENHAVVLLGFPSWGGSEWEILSECGDRGIDYGPFVTTALTTETGKFGLRVPICGSGYPSHDSLAVAVVYPDTIIVGPSFAYDVVKPTVIEATARREKDWGCDEDFTYPDGYIYEYPSITFPIP